MSRTARALLFLLRVYQSFFSALMPSACKFYPSCSQYAFEAIRVQGARRGSWLALRRILRCHPFTRGGVDLVPEKDTAQTSGASERVCGQQVSVAQALLPVRGLLNSHGARSQPLARVRNKEWLSQSTFSAASEACAPDVLAKEVRP